MYFIKAQLLISLDINDDISRKLSARIDIFCNFLQAFWLQHSLISVEIINIPALLVADKGNFKQISRLNQKIEKS